jgi:hypothetical protein
MATAQQPKPYKGLPMEGWIARWYARNTASVRWSGVLRRLVRWRLSHRRGSHADVPQHAPPLEARAVLA